MEHRVHADQLSAFLKKLGRSGTERMLSIVPDGDQVYIVRTEELDEPRRETR